MKQYLPILLILIGFGCSNSSTEATSQLNTENPKSNSADSTQVVKIVHDFFQAFDDRDLKKMEELLTPTSKIIHHNGVETGTKEMMEIISKTKNWYPRERILTKFEYFADSKIAIVGLLNEVTFSLPEDKKVYEPYNETWIFEKIENSWHPTRIHYSKIIQDEHSEEVK
ncbi:DUF4440 domain-containing protein [Algoriphagus yeomjeoni]|uniref:SnoaL-like protein n=1 Tax=Algoriphagus yeomjeoni TaxID=291403 RepID=A0A327NV36_9BACT|nr:nuclear transport factor 2 family protein [Algoriphagus yeomjeoni]RAI83870.1 SnoaL-like protein [Algoriphagus yeomjeoni]